MRGPGTPALLILRQNRVDHLVDPARLPLRVGSGPEVDLYLPGEGVAPEHAEVRAREDGRLVVELLREGRARVLRTGDHLAVGPYHLTPGPPPAPGADPTWVAPVLELLTSLCEDPEAAELPARVLRTLARALRAGWGAFLLPSADPEVAPEVVVDTGERPGGPRDAVSRTVLDKLSRTRDPVLHAEVDEGSSLGGAASLPGTIRSVIAARFAPPGGEPGLVYLESDQAGRPFGEGERELLQQLCDLAAGQLRRAREAQGLVREVGRLREVQRLASRREGDPEGFLGTSRRAREVREALGRAAAVDSPVLLLGETGTGKELAARLIHAGSARARGPFVAFNAASLPESLAESLLFGHTRGAFSGAEEERHGYLRSADGGTLLIDELADLAPPVQAKLLRALQEGVVHPLGAREPVPVDVRLVTATHGDLGARIRDGRFREDLYYRLAVLVIELPPLRRRREDLPDLVRHFLAGLNRRYGRRVEVGKPVLDALAEHRWPGNVRELRAVLEQAFVRAEGRWITTDQLRFLPGADPAGRSHAGRTLPEALAELEATMIQDVLADHGGDTKAAAARLGIGRSSLYRKCQKLGIDPGDA